MLVDEFMTRAQETVVSVVGAGTLSECMQALGDAKVFQCADKLVAYEEELLRSAIRAGSPSGTIVLDLAQLRGIDPAGLGVLVSVARFGTAHGTRLKLMNVHPAVASVLEENNLFTVFEMCSPREVIALWCRSVRQRPNP